MGTETSDGFVASILHDIGKLALDRNKQWPQDHGNLEPIGKEYNIDFKRILGDAILEIIKTHHGNIENKLYNLSELSTAQIALAIADSIESSLTWQEEVNGIGRIHQTVKFNPFYGNPEDFGVGKAHYLFKEVSKQLKNGLGIHNLMEIQSMISRYPYQHFLPHISLGIHHRMTAALYLILYNRISAMNSPTELKELVVYLTEIDPRPMRLFYRLRDAVSYSKIGEEINNQLFRKYYAKYAKDVNFEPKSNPFTFYHGSSMIFLSDEPLTAILQNALGEMHWLDSLKAKTLKMTFPFRWEKKGDSIYPIHFDSKDTSYSLIEESIISESILVFDETALHRCERCGIPISERSEKNLCSGCRVLRSRFSSGVSIDNISEKEGKTVRIAYIFLSHPNLVDHAKEVADTVLINRFIREVRLPLNSINSTQYGFLEYLQALLEIEEFQEKIWEEAEKLNSDQKEKVSIPLFRTGERLCVVLREDFLWEFLDFVSIQRGDLQMHSSVTIFITQRKTPFWNLMNFASTYKKQDVLYNVTRGEVIMFSAEEISKIREIAAEAMRRHVRPHQFNHLSKFALRTNGAELGLELDRRADRLRGLNEELKKSIETLQYRGTDLQMAEKRSIFLKYIGDLVKVGRKGRR